MWRAAAAGPASPAMCRRTACSPCLRARAPLGLRLWKSSASPFLGLTAVPWLPHSEYGCCTCLPWSSQVPAGKVVSPPSSTSAAAGRGTAQCAAMRVRGRHAMRRPACPTRPAKHPAACAWGGPPTRQVHQYRDGSLVGKHGLGLLPHLYRVPVRPVLLAQLVPAVQRSVWRVCECGGAGRHAGSGGALLRAHAAACSRPAPAAGRT